jgi:hypothetical protein
VKVVIKGNPGLARGLLQHPSRWDDWRLDYAADMLISAHKKASVAPSALGMQASRIAGVFGIFGISISDAFIM